MALNLIDACLNDPNNYKIELLKNQNEYFEINKYFVIDKDKDCPICLCNLCDIYDELVLCPVCKNIFHKKCQKEWLSKSTKKNCSLCRSKVWSYY